MKILLADDDDDIRTILAQDLRHEGHEVKAVRDGGRLLVAIGQGYYAEEKKPVKYDVLITDFMMPVITGLQLVEGIRLAHWRTPVILITGYPSEAVCNKARSLGAYLLAKPFSTEKLLEVLERVMHPGLAKTNPLMPCEVSHTGF